MGTRDIFDPVLYKKIGYDELVVFSAARIHQDGKEITFENLVAECFECFPERFALRGYPQWPDSAVVNKSWLRCRTDKGYLTGSVKDGFRLTGRGFEVAEKTEKLLIGKRKVAPTVRRKLTEERTREGRFLKSLERSKAFESFARDKTLEQITDFDVCDMLLCTLDTSASTRSSNLRIFRHAAELYGRDDVLRFLSEVEVKFGHLFRAPAAGGMMAHGRSRN
jgi:hypothetical protein